MSNFKRNFYRIVALILMVNLLTEVLFPTVAFALTSGPAQPEYSSFEPVATTNMVNNFSGDFTYNLPMMNIPGPNGGGYAVSLSYHSGVSPEEEASWVGYGWTLNPGAIQRGKKGLPDDFKGSPILRYNKTMPNITVSAGLRLNFEIYSVDLANGSALSVAPSIRYNNYKGFSTALGLGLAMYDGLASIDYNVSGETGHSFSFDINPGALFAEKAKRKKEKIDLAISIEQDCWQNGKSPDLYKSQLEQANIENMEELIPNKANKFGRFAGFVGAVGSQYAMHALADEYRVSNIGSYNAISTNVTVNLGATPLPFELHPNAGVFGNFTKQTPSPVIYDEGYGYFYQTEALSNPESVMDYTVEKEAMFNKRDQFLSIPYSAPDNFLVTGEGLGGGFRMYSKRVGHFYPSQRDNHTDIYNLMVDTELGLDNGGGFNVGAGTHQLKVAKTWGEPGDENLFYFGESGKDESCFFRFDSDLGGNVIYSNNDQAYKVYVHQTKGIPGSKSYNIDIDETQIKSSLGDVRTTRASYIGFTINKDMISEIGGNNSNIIPYKSYNKSTNSRDFVNRGELKIEDGIGEIATYNEEGHKYVYGLPVYARQEANIAYSVKEIGNKMPTIQNNHIVYKNIPDPRNESKTSNSSLATIVGEVVPDPYATTYLLTQITTPDYIDRTLNGPTNDDFGGWTKFNYKRVYGSNSKLDNIENTDANKLWYQWRLPYNGFYYNRGELSDSRDDMANLTSGQKEVYYLESIETKTHIAYFVTNKTIIKDKNNNIVIQGSGIDRKDALGASDDVTAGKGASLNSTMKLQRLEKIALYAKDPADPAQVIGKPLKVANLDYYEEGADYSTSKVLSKNLPNSAHTYSNSKKGGRLTLRRVWFEYEGIVSTKISPYEFKYAYKPLSEFQTDGPVRAKYESIIEYGQGLNENPDYDPFKTDSWGNYAYDNLDANGRNRRKLMKHWVYQGKKEASMNYDPACWQLKNIVLPSGGEILIQYEQHEYRFVQDKTAMNMISLSEGSENDNVKDQSDAIILDKYFLNLNEMDLDVNENNSVDAEEAIALVDSINKQDHIYFKFLYTLIGSASPDPENCDGDYISGYAKAKATYVSTTGQVYLEFQGDEYSLPRDVCQNFVTRTKAGLNISSDCNGDINAMDESNPLSAVKMVFNRLKTDFAGDKSNCKRMSLAHSYFRIPVIKSKKGGGVRVKRVLMYDPGIESGDEALYGTEYVYEEKDGLSSGVATNEPAGSREENALINFMAKRVPQKWTQVVISGEDKEQFEGPLGENLLPPASVGYSRVIEKSIHNGKTSPGFTVHEYYTTQSHPTIKVDFTDIDDHAKDFFPLPAGIVNVNVDNRWLAQGYCFTLNEMNGKQKRVAVFGGEYSDIKKESDYRLSFEEIYEYTSVGEKVKVMKENGIIMDDYLGKETEVVMEMKSIEDIQSDFTVEVDFNVGIAVFVPIPQFSICPYYTYNEKKLRTHVINKIIHYPSVLKSITRKQDHVKHTTTNLVYSGSTGSPLITVTKDSYDGLTINEVDHQGAYTNYTLPAHLIKEFRLMGQKAQNERFEKSFGTLIPLNASFEADLSSYADLFSNNYLVPGDLIELSNGSNKGLYYIDNTNNNKLKLQPLSFVSNSISNFDKLKVLESGFTNQLNVSAGTIIRYGEDLTKSGTNIVSPFSVISGETQLNSSLTNILAVSVETYSDEWSRGDVNSEYGLSGNSNDFETGRRGKWRLSSSYSYKSDVKDGVTANNSVYNAAGVYTGTFTPFNYSNRFNDSEKWLRGTQVNAYSPNGNALEEENILGVKSTAKFGYDESVPVLIAQNASYSSVTFKHFEDVTGATSLTAHSGNKSYQINSGSTYSLASIIADAQIRKGLSVKFWVKTGDKEDLKNCKVTAEAGSNQTVSMEPIKISRVGDWILYEAKLVNLSASQFNDGVSTVLKFVNGMGQHMFIDDIRVQPLDAQMNCYVYDRNNLRLLASFDDQHFGLYYQYNAEGKLVRKLVETERGIKTVTEAQYNNVTKLKQ